MGPSSEPDRYRLVGAGEDGWWRAVDATGDEVELLIVDVLDSASWQANADAALTVDLPNIARSIDAFVSADGLGAIVIQPVAGTSLDRWLADRPRTSSANRIGLLRQVAAALDELHGGGADRHPLAHGSLDASAVRVQEGGRVVLVGVGTTVADAPDDAAAFAVLVARTLADEWREDLDGAVRALSRSDAGRERPLLVLQVAGVLDAPPDSRPRRLRTWLDVAADESSETSAGDLLATTLGTHGQVPQRARRRRSVVFAAAGIGLLAVAGVVFVTADLSSGKSRESSSSSASKGTVVAAPPLRLASWSWPMVPGCDGTTAVANIDADLPTPSKYGGGDIRQRVAQSPLGGAWYEGHLRLTFAAGSRDIVITNVTPKRLGTTISTPLWVLRPAAVACPASRASDATYTYDMATGDFPYRPLVIAARHEASLDIDMRNCSGNVAMTFLVRFSFPGERPALLDTSALRVQIFGTAAGTATYTRTGSTDVQGPSLNNHDRACT